MLAVSSRRVLEDGLRYKPRAALTLQQCEAELAELRQQERTTLGYALGEAADVDALTAKLQQCEAALQFYADLQTYHEGDTAPILDDCGFRARQVLYQRRDDRVHDVKG